MARKIAVVFFVIMSMAGLVSAGERYGSARLRFGIGIGSGAPLERRVYNPLATNYVPYHAPIWVISPYGLLYQVTPEVVVTSPYFCVLHNYGFVSRIGLLDHLAGTHKIPLNAATMICPESLGNCVFPSY